MINRFRARMLLGVCLALMAYAPGAGAQAISKTVTLVVPYAAGGGTDTVARLVGDQMARALGRSVVIENVLLVDAAVAAGGTRLLDVGCGAGSTTLAVARALGPDSRCTGVDISAPLIAAATARAAAGGAANVRFIEADAQTYAFDAGSFDTVISPGWDRTAACAAPWMRPQGLRWMPRFSRHSIRSWRAMRCASHRRSGG